MTTTTKLFGIFADVDLDLFGVPVPRPRDDGERLAEAIDGLRETLGDYFDQDLAGADGALNEFGYEFDILERPDIRALAAADLENAMRAEIKFWDSQP